jgi:hypothetical protein
MSSYTHFVLFSELEPTTTTSITIESFALLDADADADTDGGMPT